MGATNQDQMAADSVLRWRFQGLASRLIQAFAIGGLAALVRPDWSLVPWLILVIGTNIADAVVSRRLFARPDDAPLRMGAAAARIAASGSFAAVCLLVLPGTGVVGTAAGLLIACGACLNNAVMTRGRPAYAWTLVGPSAAALLAIPAVLWLAQAISLPKAALLTVGSIAYLLFITRLTSVMHQESRTLREALEAAEAASQAKTSFLATMSHEIRTPLNGVLGMAQAVVRDGLSEPQRERMEVLQASGEALLAILNDILDLSKIEAGKLELELSEFDLEQLASGAYAAFTAQANTKGLSFGFTISDAAKGAYRGDSLRLRQILYNLLANALKFTEEGAVKAEIDSVGGRVVIAVHDTGIGIDADKLEGLFEKFTQADSSTTRRFGGTGLGLAICAELVRAMDGEIDAVSEPGGGSTFTVRIPLERADGVAASSPSPAAPAPAASTALAELNLRVLAAEDNKVNQIVLRTLLAQFGIQPVIVETGEDAIETWRHEVFDLILMDVQMPVMDGPAAAREIRAEERRTGRARTPIVALTANAMSHQADAYLAAGMDDVLAKPIEVARLLEVVSAVCDAASRPMDQTPARARA